MADLDYQLLITGQLDQPPQEPNDYEFFLMIKQQEINRNKNGRVAKGTRNGA